MGFSVDIMFNGEKSDVLFVDHQNVFKKPATLW